MNSQLIEEYIENQSTAKENFIALYLKENQLSINDIVLIEKRDGLTTTWYCERKSSTESEG